MALSGASGHRQRRSAGYGTVRRRRREGGGQDGDDIRRGRLRARDGRSTGAAGRRGRVADAGGLEIEGRTQLADELGAEVAAAAARIGIAIEYLVRHGDPLTELSRVADELPADGVVVGASQQGVHRFLGSLASRLVRGGRWPVTVVP
jgi:nucleotide-binding universal stress UspA family protein